MTPEQITAILLGLGGVLTAASGLLAARVRGASSGQRALRRDLRTLQRQFHAALRHIFVLETTLSIRGLPVPDRPALLDLIEEDGDEPREPAHAR